MFKKASIIFFILLFIFSCWLTNKKKLPILSEWKLDITIDDKLETLLSEYKLLRLLHKVDSWDLLEEIPRIDSYYTEDPFYEFYIYSSIKNNDVNKCDFILNKTNKELCINLFNNQNSLNDIIKIYWKNNEGIIFAKNVYNMFYIIKNNKECIIDDKLLYFSCKKILDKNFDVVKENLEFSVLEHSYSIYSDDILNYWGKDKWFRLLIEKILPTK